VFTFGREHEKRCAAGYFRKPADPAALLALIDAVHDLVEGKVAVGDVRARLVECLVHGGARTWEGAGYWLEKVKDDFPALLTVWTELARHPQAEVRWRIACLVECMPAALRSELTPVLLADASRRVRRAAAVAVRN
jgi:hypothetical protein